MPKYSIVMPCLFNKESKRIVIQSTLDSINENSSDCEIIVVDDGSEFPTGFLKEGSDTIIRHVKTRGIAPSWNDGKNIAKGEYVAIINDDIKVPNNWLETMSKAFEMYETCGVSLVMNAGPDEEPELHKKKEWVSNYKWPSGYCFMLKKDRFFEDFDEQFVPFNFEDIDYWERITGSGHTLIKSPLTIWHKEGATIHEMKYEETDNKNLKKFIDKWGFNPKDKYFG